MRGNKKEREKLAKILSDALLKEDVTKKHFAEFMGIKPDNMYKYLRSEVFPTYDDFEKIYTYLGYTFDELFDMVVEPIHSRR